MHKVCLPSAAAYFMLFMALVTLPPLFRFLFSFQTEAEKGDTGTATLKGLLTCQLCKRHENGICRPWKDFSHVNCVKETRTECVQVYRVIVLCSIFPSAPIRNSYIEKYHSNLYPWSMYGWFFLVIYFVKFIDLFKDLSVQLVMANSVCVCVCVCVCVSMCEFALLFSRHIFVDTLVCAF